MLPNADAQQKSTFTAFARSVLARDPGDDATRPAAVPSHGSGGASDAGSAASACSLNQTAAGGQSGPSGAAKRGQNGPLGNTGKSVDPISRQIDGNQDEKTQKYRALRVERFQLQRRSSAILPGWPVGTCKWAFQRESDHAGVMKNADGRAFFNGLQTCGSVWVCPVCSAKISEVRRSELNAALAWAREAGHIPLMLTLTHRHGAGDDLSGQVKALKKAKQRLRQRKEWRFLRQHIVGTITATEVTQGVSGWHTHFHEIVLVRGRDGAEAATVAADEKKAVAIFARLASVWVACLRGVGLDGLEKRAWQVQGAASAGEYVAKWGAAEEVALGNKKQGRRSGRTPWQILAAANPQDADCEFSALFAEYATAFRGTRQLVWSPGLKALVGLDEVADADAAEAEAEPELIARLDRMEWNGSPGRLGARYRRGRVLTAAETDGAAGVARVVADGLDDEGRKVAGDAPAPVEVIDYDDPANWDLPAPFKDRDAAHIPQPGDTRRPSSGAIFSGQDSRRVDDERTGTTDGGGSGGVSSRSRRSTGTRGSGSFSDAVASC